MGGTVLGRDEILDTVEALAFSGETVLVYGPLGIGKTAILGQLAHRADHAGRPCAICPRTERLSDVTEALVRGYATRTGALTQRKRRSRVRLAIEHNPGILLLDHLLEVGSAVKGYLRSLRGTGLGVLIAADVEQSRDHAHVRALGLAYRELALPPLHGRHLRRLLDFELRSGRLPYAVPESDREALIDVARGRPGWIVRLAAAASQMRYWRGDRLLIELLATDVSMAVTSHYGARLNERWSRR